MKKILLVTLITLSTYASSLSLDPANHEVKDFQSKPVVSTT